MTEEPELVVVANTETALLFCVRDYLLIQAIGEHREGQEALTIAQLAESMDLLVTADHDHGHDVILEALSLAHVLGIAFTMAIALDIIDNATDLAGARRIITASLDSAQEVADDILERYSDPNPGGALN